MTEGEKVHCTCGADDGRASLPDRRLAWRHNGLCPHADAQQRRALRRLIADCGYALERSARTGAMSLDGAATMLSVAIGALAAQGARRDQIIVLVERAIAERSVP